MICVKKLFYIRKSQYGKSRVFRSKNPKILNFKARSNILTDSDITNLFMGFVRLIKKSIICELEKKYQDKIEYLTRRLNENLSKEKNINKFKVDR